MVAEFHQAHKETYGYANPHAPVEIVNLRLKAIGQVPSPELGAQPFAGTDPSTALVGTYPVMLANGKTDIPFYDGDQLQPGNQIPGPAVVLRTDTTILIEAQDKAEMDATLNLIITVG